MNRLLIPLAATALLAGACSSTHTAQDTRPLPAQAAGTLVTPWGHLPTYKSKGQAFVLNPDRAPAPRSARGVEVDVLVERDGTVREVFVRKASGQIELDALVAARFKEGRSRLVLAPTDPAPYVIRDSLAHYVSRDTRGRIASDPFPMNGLRSTNGESPRTMGTGAPYWGDRSN